MAKISLEEIANEMIELFTHGIFHDPHEFSDQQIEAIASIVGVDAKGTFADAPMEQSLIRVYKLDVDNWENTWPAFAEILRDEKDIHFSRFSDSDREGHLKWLREAIAYCLMVGISREQIIDEAVSAY